MKKARKHQLVGDRTARKKTAKKYQRICSVDRRTNECRYCIRYSSCPDVQEHMRKKENKNE